MLRRFAVLFAVVGCIAAVGVAGCGSKSSSSSTGAAPAQSSPSTPASTPSTTPSTSFAKTKFVLHFALAGGAFHRYIYKPFKAGVFGRPASHKAAIVKAALASVFVFHELKLAATDAQSIPVLRALFAPIQAAAHRVSLLATQLRGGKTDAATINAVQADGGSIASAAAAKGYPSGDATPAQLQSAGLALG